MKVVKLNAEPRDKKGTAEVRRMRRAGRLPGVVYGRGKTTKEISVGMRDFSRALEKGARVLDLEVEGLGDTRVLLKDVQYDALGRKLLHADFLRLDPDRQLDLNVPITFEGSPKGLSLGGILTVQRDQIQVRCLPQHIPDSLTILMAPLDLGESVYARDVDLPEHVELASDPDAVVVTVSIPRGVAADDEEGEDAEGEGGEEAASEGESA